MKPRIFIGSSLEGMDIANSIQELLQYDSEPTVWNQDIFKLSKSSLESLVIALDNFDFGLNSKYGCIKHLLNYGILGVNKGLFTNGCKKVLKYVHIATQKIFKTGVQEEE
jgi:hypothetical protein